MSPPKQDPSAKAGDPGDLSTIPIRVLIVDDDEAHAQAVAESLTRIGCDCVAWRTRRWRSQSAAPTI